MLIVYFNILYQQLRGSGPIHYSVDYNIYLYQDFPKRFISFCYHIHNLVSDPFLLSFMIGEQLFHNRFPMDSKGSRMAGTRYG